MQHLQLLVRHCEIRLDLHLLAIPIRGDANDVVLPPARDQFVWVVQITFNLERGVWRVG